MRIPDYGGGSIANLMAELEGRLGTTPPLPGLNADLAAAIPDADTYVVVLFDGLGDHQLAHPAASSLAGSRVGRLDACFPTTTAVSMASMATSLAPAGHGILSHFLHLRSGTVNALKWRTISGKDSGIDTTTFLPETAWERLGAVGKEPITVQPASFEGTPLSRLLYRGARFEGVWSASDWIDATASMAGTPGRLIFAYWPMVDVAAHTAGQDSDVYRSQLAEVDGMWSHLTTRLSEGAVAVATADHGHLDYGRNDREPLDRHGATVFGDPRALFLRTDDDRAARLAGEHPVTLIDDPRPLLGPGDHPDLAHRAPSHVLLSDRGKLVIPSFMDDRLVGYHGGLEPEEVEVPLLVAAP